MKMVIAIVQDQDSQNLSEALIEKTLEPLNLQQLVDF